MQEEGKEGRREGGDERERKIERERERVSLRISDLSNRIDDGATY